MDETIQRTVCPTGTVWAWNDKYECLYNLACSEYAGSIAEQIEIPNVAQAEAALQKATARLDDEAMREALDEAAGMIARAYQIIGFMAGCISQTEPTRETENLFIASRAFRTH